LNFWNYFSFTRNAISEKEKKEPKQIWSKCTVAEELEIPFINIKQNTRSAPVESELVEVKYDPQPFLEKVKAGMEVTKFSMHRKRQRVLKLRDSVLRVTAKEYPLSGLHEVKPLGNEKKEFFLTSEQRSKAIKLKHESEDVVLMCSTKEETDDLLSGLNYLIVSR